MVAHFELYVPFSLVQVFFPIQLECLVIELQQLFMPILDLQLGQVEVVVKQQVKVFLTFLTFSQIKLVVRLHHYQIKLILLRNSIFKLNFIREVFCQP